MILSLDVVVAATLEIKHVECGVSQAPDLRSTVINLPFSLVKVKGTIHKVLYCTVQG
jgi:hypothetical protein